MIKKRRGRRRNTDSVRFSIIENDLQWESQKENLISEDDDHKSISSESSGDGGGIPIDFPCVEQKNNLPQTPEENWQSNLEIELIARELPNSNNILEIITLGNLSESINDGTISDVNNVLLLAILMGRNDIVINLLHEYHADANSCDSQGRTALQFTCLTNNAILTKILLVNGADVNKWDTEKTSTALHCAARGKSIECIQLLLRRGAHVNAGIEKRSALHIAVEARTLSCIEILLKHGANPNTPQVYTETPLHTAASLGDYDTMELLLRHGADVRSQYGQMRLTALHIAAENDYTKCVKLLLENGAKVDARNFNNQTALHMACLSQCGETVEILIKFGADVNATYKDGRSALHAAIVKESKCYECAKHLLEAGVEVNKPDNYGYTALHIAALNESSTCTNMLIEYGADITAQTNGGISALSFIVRRTPEVIPKFLAKFDSSITVNEHEIGDVDCEIKLDFRLLVPNTERGETELLLAFIEVGKKRILKHPLCETFIYLKWRRIRKFFLFSLFYHSVYVLLFTLYILGVYDKDCSFEGHGEKAHCEAASYVAPIGYGAIAMNFVMLGKEFFQMAHGFSGYIRFWENWVQWAIILGVFLCTTPNAMKYSDIKSVPVWQHHVAGVVIFLVWLELMMLVGRFPIFGLYVQMFTKVSVNFAKFLMAYCCLLIAFGLSFGVLFANYPAFKYVPWTLMKTITMMAGELEFEDIFYGDTKILYPGTAHAMFVTFVLLVTVILTNLLVGLAVSDIQGLQASAGLDRLSRQAELVARLESLFFSKLLRKAPREIILLCQRSALLRTSRYHLQFCIRPNDPRDNRLPKDIVVSIYKLVAERRDRNQSIRRRKREQNLSFLPPPTRLYEMNKSGGGGGGIGGGGGSNIDIESSLKDVQIRNRTTYIADTLQQQQPRVYSADNANVNLYQRQQSHASSNLKDIDINLEVLKMQIQSINGKINELNTTVTTKLGNIVKEFTDLRMELLRNNRDSIV